MLSLKGASLSRLLVAVNAVLFTLAVVRMWGAGETAQPQVPDREAGARASSTSRALLFEQGRRKPGPCVCSYNVHDGGVEQIEGAQPSPAPTPVPRNKIGQDLIQDQEYQVPNIVHYIWYNTEPRPLQFNHMLSILSAHRMLKPDVIYFHTDIEPVGEYWDKVRAIPSFKINHRKPPTELFGEAVKEPRFYTSHSNVDRVKILMEYGGIYLDFDTLVTRSMDDLRKHVCTIGYESETKACGSVIVCSKESFFLYLWINAYLDDYRMDEWAYNTGKVPFKLSKRYPHLVHVEKTRLNRPNFAELDQIWGPNTWNWRENYAVHLWYRLWKDQSPYYHGIEPNPDNVKTWNSTFGEMARTILYGKPEMIHVDE